MKDLKDTEKLETNPKTDELVEKMTAINISKDESEERAVRQPHEDEEAADNQDLNKLSEDIEKLNIKPENKDDDESLTQRGPTGGVAVQLQTIMGQKNIPIGPMGNYMPPQMDYPQKQMKGNRRTLDEAEDQPQKYFRPPPFHYGTAPMQQQSNFPQQYGTTATFTPSFTQTQQNNLSQGLVQSQRFNFSPQHEFQFNNLTSSLTTTNVRNTSNMSGGKVTLSQPSFPDNNYADALLAEISEQHFSPIAQGNLPHFTVEQLGNISNWEPNMINNIDGDLTKTSFTEMRRRSDPVDSGIESEGGSPFSEQAPSPSSSTYTSPPSVESGCGRSPMHESQFQHGMSPPKYPGAMSPGSYRATPSPANTTGYGSPGQPQPDDDLINEVLLEDAMAVIKADLNTQESKKKQRQISVSTQPSVSAQMIPNNVAQPLTFNQQLPPGIVRPSVMIPPLQNQQMPPQTYTGLPVTTAGRQQQIIIIQPQQQKNQPFILVPVQTSPAPAKKKTGQTQYKKILPKLSQPPNSSTTGGCNVTMASSNPLTMSTKGGGHLNRNMTQPNPQAQQQQNKLLMIARRTVADIPREDLRKSDDEGDTYLHIAVCKTDKNMVKALLERLHREKLVQLVDQENHKKQTPLYLAVFINQPVMVAMLIRFQADVNVLARSYSSDGTTMEVKSAIHVAASQGVEYHRTLQELLKAKDISINIVNNYGQTAMHCAILANGKLKRNSSERTNSAKILETLIQAKADPSAQDKKNGKTPLMYAIEQKNLELVETILRTVDADKVKNVVKTQAFDGSSCLKIAEGLKGSSEVEIWNKIWGSLQNATSDSMARYQY